MRLLYTLSLILVSTFYSISAWAQSPGFDWAKRAGGIGNDDLGAAVVVDAAGYSYLTGSFQLSAQFGNLTLPSTGGGHDTFVAKYDPAGNAVWVKKPYSAHSDGGESIGIDAAGNVYVMGFFYSVISFNNMFLTDPTGSGQMYLVKYSPAGIALWARQAGGGGSVSGADLKVDSAGNCYVTGAFRTITGYPVFGTTTFAGSGGYDAYLAKFDTFGNVMWAKEAGWKGDDIASNLAIDDLGNSYITGFFEDTIRFGNTLLADSSYYSAFVAKYDSSGNFIWAKKLSSTASVVISGVAVDKTGNWSVTGGFLVSASIDSVHLTADNFFNDMFLATYDPSGNLLWVRQESGTNAVAGGDMALDSSGNRFVTGLFTDTAFFGTDTLISSGDRDIFIVKYDASGNFQWVKQAGGANLEICFDLFTNAIGECFLTGQFKGTSFFDGTSLVCSGTGDMFFAKLNHSPGSGLQAMEPVTSPRVTLSPNPASQQVLLTFTGFAQLPFTRISLHNLLGQEVYSKSIVLMKTASEVLVPLNGLAPGLYMLHVPTHEGTISRKLMVE